MNLSVLHFFADYSCGTYGSSAFGSTCGETLASTGDTVILPFAIGVCLVLAAAIAFIIMHTRRRAAK